MLQLAPGSNFVLLLFLILQSDSVSIVTKLLHLLFTSLKWTSTYKPY